MKKEILATAFMAVLFLSMQFGSLPLVSAAYTIEEPYMPPDLKGDFNCDGKVDYLDLYLFREAYIFPEYHPLYDLNGDGVVNFLDFFIFRKCYVSGETEGPPIAYSTNFDFAVPNDGDYEVWYYVFARVYVPSELGGQGFYFVAGADDGVQNVKLDKSLKSGGGGSVNIDLGSLSSGYHLLEFEFVEIWGSGWLNFHVATAGGNSAWLPRFRIYVPNYSDNEVRYTVKTRTYFPGDDFFLGGYADDFIDDVYVDVGMKWQDWEWWTGDVSTSIYAWGDGFMYPLGWQGPQWHDITFTFGEIWGAGLVDFQFISWTHQRDKFGPPKFYSSVQITDLGSHLTLNEGKIYGGSRWESSENPEISERTYEIRTRYNVSYNDGSTWFNASLEIGVGNWWAEWGLTKGTHDDIGIPLNLTLVSFESNLPTGYILGVFRSWSIYLKDYTIDAYSFPNLRITGMEADTGDSKGKIAPGYIAAMDFGGEVLLTVAGLVTLIPGGQIVGIIGALVGLSFMGLNAVIEYTQGQEVSRYNEAIRESNHWQLESTSYLEVYPPAWPIAERKSVSDIVFLGLDPTAGKHCGSTKVFLKGTLEAAYFIFSPDIPPVNYYFPIGDIEITLCIPWFLWP